MASGTEEIYVDQLHTQAREVIEQLTLPKNWDFAQFRKVLVALSMSGEGNYVPAANRPDSIHIQNLSPYFEDLIKRSTSSGLEYSRTILTDVLRKALIVSGRVTQGTRYNCTADWTPEAGRERYQKRTASIHVHPSRNLDTTTETAAHGFSQADYTNFFYDPQQLVMIIAFGRRSLLMALKTSSSPNSISIESIERRIKSCADDFLQDPSLPLLIKVVNFNKAVCTEFGSTLYMADEKSRDLMRRVEVTKW